MVVTYEPSTVYLPNITVEKQMADGVHIAYRLTANEGYVLHDTTADETIYDPDGNVIEVFVQYFRRAYIPIKYDPSVWTWEAVLESEVPPDKIYGSVDNEETI